MSAEGLVSAVLVAGWAAGTYLYVRNVTVARYRLRLLYRVHEAAADDIALGLPWEWRYDALDRVSQWRMLFSFRPPASFYSDLSFTERAAGQVAE